MTVLILSGCLDFEGVSAAMLTYTVSSPKGFTMNKKQALGLKISLTCHPYDEIMGSPE